MKRVKNNNSAFRKHKLLTPIVLPNAQHIQQLPVVKAPNVFSFSFAGILPINDLDGEELIN